MKTDDLIAGLVAKGGRTRRLPSPEWRTTMWLFLALPVVAAVVLAMSPRPDLAQKLAEPRYLVEQAAAFLTALAAAYAAFTAIVPGRPRGALALPLIPFAIWMASLGKECVAILVTAGAEGLHIEWDWVCIPAIAMVGAVPAVAMVLMLRRGAPIQPAIAIALGALAAAALGNFGLRLFHDLDAALTVLVWQFGTVILLTCLAACAGRCLLPWSRG